jgi:hypothetical protein
VKTSLDTVTAASHDPRMRIQIFLRKQPRVGRRIAQRKRDGRYGLLLRFLFLRIILWDRDHRGRVV